ncbi:oligopeptide ABC transporter permease [Spiroplasma sp. TIUS-1]|uniref:oligopeptide ABC transporter permease OppC n=1 Tax=Spiroplasma sp. TIUS-1 TaxID=216963 RepID=UPI001398200C|nr:oligopeptide ABC transporter permease OppC [Spiroplasma sp. TIUS-1]QHX36089.1 oligopeptide ABC transporter permease [Spiroplasma sp. TIUS-1]
MSLFENRENDFEFDADDQVHTIEENFSKKQIVEAVDDRVVDLKKKLEIAHLTESELFTLVGVNKNEGETINPHSYSYWGSVFGLLFKSKVFIVCAILFLAIIALSIIVPIGKNAWPLPDDPTQVFPDASKAPSMSHWFGLGVYGEDYWTTIWIGTSVTLLFAIIIASIQILIGIIIGSIWGYNKKLDIAFIEVTRFLTLIPTLVLWLIVILLFTSSDPKWKNSMFVVIIAVSITSWVALASTIRVQVMLVKNTEYNTASITLGSSGRKIVTKNILPRILPVIVQTASFSIPNAIAIDSTLNYFGFSFLSAGERKYTSLGKILNLSLADNKWEANPSLLIFPLIMIALISIVFFLIGKTFADYLDPKTHR